MNSKRNLSMLTLVLKDEKGMILAVSLMLMALLTVMAGSAFVVTTSELRMTGNFKTSEQAFYAAEGGAEYGVGRLRQVLNNVLNPSASDLNIAAPALSGITFDVLTAEKDGPVEVRPITIGTFAGLNSYIQRYRITSEARVTGTSARSRIVLHAEDNLIPLFQFGVFYENDLEMLPGPNMTYTGGRMHSNSAIYVGANNTFSIDSQVSSANKIFNKRKDDGTVPPGTVQIKDGGGMYQAMKQNNVVLDSNHPDWTTESQSRWGGRVKSDVHGVQKINLPLPQTNTPIDIIKRGQGLDSQQLKDARYYWKAGLRIIDGQAYNKDGLPLDLTQGGNNPLSTQSFYDAREGTNITTTQIDVDLLKLNTVAMGALGAPPPGQDAGILYASGGGANNGVRLVNGSSLPSGGLTVASDNPIYIKGDYNVGNLPSAVIGDAVTILSNNWSDANSTAPLSSRVATPTTVKGAIMAGHKGTVGNQYSGGVENFPRFLESWSGTTFTYSGSLVSLWQSEKAIGNWVYGSPVYTAPTRNWSYGIDLSNLPPGTPRVRFVQKIRWYHAVN